MIVTQTYCDQNTTKISIVHTINNWHASCTRNFKNPLASTYSSFTSKFLNKWLISNNQISHKTFRCIYLIVPPNVTSLKSFDQENLITKRLLFTIRIAHSKAETQQHASFGQYVFNNTKALTKVTKRSSKEAKKAL